MNEVIPTITGLSGRPMSVSSLRPGDVIESKPFPDGIEPYRYVVIINSVKLKRIVLRDSISETPFNYWSLGMNLRFIRHQSKRRWLAFLPKWIAKQFSPYAL